MFMCVHKHPETSLCFSVPAGGVVFMVRKLHDKDE